MEKEVTIRGLNRAYIRELFSSKAFWFGIILYIVGIIIFIYNALFGGIVMLVSALIMLNADWNGRKRVVKNLRWAR